MYLNESIEEPPDEYLFDRIEVHEESNILDAKYKETSPEE